MLPLLLHVLSAILTGERFLHFQLRRDKNTYQKRSSERRQVLAAMPLARCPGDRAKAIHHRCDHVARNSEAAFLENVVSNLFRVFLGLGRQDITVHPASRRCSISSNSVRSLAENDSPLTTSPRSDCKN